jgi:predicted DNA-binding protein YlxM (UPF0122 family)
VETIARRSLLFDFYGPFLTNKQQEIYDYYYQQDLSLGEIAQNQGVTRQAVYDLLKRAEETLEGAEEKLGLVNKYENTCRILAEINSELARLRKENPSLEWEYIFKLVSELENNW